MLQIIRACCAKDRPRITQAAWLTWLITLSLANGGVLAQTPPITSSGLNTQVSGPIAVGGKTQFDITGGTRPGGGTNLFHSFGQFNVPNNNIANFLNDSGMATSNILGRVTDGNPSNIFGTIQTTGFGGANLFLMNPAGIVFGPNATLNVGGSVAFTTANYLRLADNRLFNAIPNPITDALLSAAPVAAYGFLGSNPGAITVQGSQFTLSDGTGISLVGGNITIQSGTPDGGTAQPARLSAPNGTIQLASAASPGEFDAVTLQALPNVNGTSFTSFGSVSLAPGSNINVSGANTVSIRGGQFVLSVNDAVLSTSQTAAQPETISLSPGSSIVTSNSEADPGADVQLIASNVQMDGASIQSLTTGDGPGGNLTVNASNVNFTNASIITTESDGTAAGGNILIQASNVQLDGASIQSLALGDGSGGSISIGGETISLTNGAQIGSTTLGAGAGGPILLNANNDITVNNFSVITSSALSDGHGGDIQLSARNVTFDSGFFFSTASGNAAGGNLSIIASEAVELRNGSFMLSSTDSTQPGGNIGIQGNTVAVRDSSIIQSDSQGAGHGGNITVHSTESLLITSPADSDPPSLIMSSAGGNSPSGGAIDISASTISMGDSGAVQTTAAGSAKGGNISLHAEHDLTMTNAAMIESSTAGSGPSGMIVISVGGTLSLIGNFDANSSSRIVNRSASFLNDAGANGGISLEAGTLLLRNGARIFTNTTNAPGGDISILAQDSVQLSSGSRISILNDLGNFGSLSISASSITIDGQGTGLSTRTLGPQNAGDISLKATAGDIVLSGGSDVVASTEQSGGAGGTITANATGSVIISGGSSFQSNSFRGPGLGGPILITAGDTVSISDPGSGLFTEARGTGTGGDIQVSANQVLLTNGASISAKSNPFIDPLGSGNGGNITIKTSILNMNTGASLTASSVIGPTGIVPTGSAGSITVEGASGPAQSVLIDGAGSGIFTDTQGTGAGGNIFVNANSMTLQNGGTLSAKTSGSAPTARGGSINVNATDQVAMAGGALITASSTGAADAGNITINAGNTFMMTNSSVITKSDNAGGGNIAIRAVDQVRLVNSKINASAYLDGGNITIDPNSVILQNSQILAQAIVGNGGAINIFTPLFLADQTSLVDASSQFGLSGPVNIQSPTSNLAGSIASLPSSLRQAQTLQTGRCAALHGETSSSFVVAGRETIPTEPGGWVVSPIASLTARAGLTVGGEGEEIPRPNMEEMQIVSLRRLTPIGFLTQYFAESAAIGCRT